MHASAQCEHPQRVPGSARVELQHSRPQNPGDQGLQETQIQTQIGTSLARRCKQSRPASQRQNVFFPAATVTTFPFVNMDTSGSSVGSSKSTVATMPRAKWCAKSQAHTLLSPPSPPNRSDPPTRVGIRAFFVPVSNCPHIPKLHAHKTPSVSFPAQNGECFKNVRNKSHSLDDREHGCPILSQPEGIECASQRRAFYRCDFPRIAAGKTIFLHLGPPQRSPHRRYDR